MAYSAWKLSHDQARRTSLELQSQLPELARFLSPAAWRTVQLRLASDLRPIYEPCCEVENSVAAALHFYEAGGEMLSRYPVADRLVGELSENWRRFIWDFLENWVKDWPEIRHLVGGSDFPEHVRFFGQQTSDPHDGGKRVLVLELAGRRRIVYKPRSLGCEFVYNALLAEINAAVFPWPLRTVAVLDFQNHGWMEYVEKRACTNRAQIENYFHRAGALICLFHALAGVDGHSENLIAAGEQPVLIDLETLLHPETPGDPTIFRTGLLPVKNEPEYTLAAFGGHFPASPQKHTAAMVRGYTAMVDLLETCIPLSAWAEKLSRHPRRRILHSTSTYLAFQGRSLAPSLLSNEKARQEVIEEFSCKLTSSQKEQRQQQEAMDRLDIPRNSVTRTVPIPSIADLLSQVPLLHGAFD